MGVCLGHLLHRHRTPRRRPARGCLSSNSSPSSIVSILHLLPLISRDHAAATFSLPHHYQTTTDWRRRCALSPYACGGELESALGCCCDGTIPCCRLCYHNPIATYSSGPGPDVEELTMRKRLPKGTKSLMRRDVFSP